MTTATVNRVRALIGAMNTGDSEVLLEMLGDDVVWHVAGRNSLSGTYRGPQQFLGVVQRFTEMTANNFSLEVVDILADERHAARPRWQATAVQGTTCAPPPCPAPRPRTTARPWTRAAAQYPTAADARRVQRWDRLAGGFVAGDDKTTAGDTVGTGL